MELEKAIKYLEHEVKVYENNKEINQLISGKAGKTQNEVYKTVLQALDNSIPKEKVLEKIQELKHKQVGASTGIYEALCYIERVIYKNIMKDRGMYK